MSVDPRCPSCEVVLTGDGTKVTPITSLPESLPSVPPWLTGPGDIIGWRLSCGCRLLGWDLEITADQITFTPGKDCSTPTR